MPSGIVYFFIFIFGACVGSFLNVIILRYNTGQSPFKGSSYCFSCKKNLRWCELIPIFSFLLQRGKCRVCGSKISWQYFIIEIITGLLFLMVTWKSGFQVETQLLFMWLIVSLLIIISVYDFKHKIIPNAFVYSFIILAFFWILFENWNLGFVWKLAGDLLSGFAFFAFFALLWAFSRGQWMGLGDAKLALGLGWLLGPMNTFSAFLFSFFLGSIIGVSLIIFSKNKFGMKSQIPFGPFLVAGSLLALFLNINIFEYLSFYG